MDIAQLLGRVMLVIFIASGCSHKAPVQPVVTPWGNLQGIRVDGQLMKVETNVRLNFKNGSFLRTAKEHQLPDYIRKGDKRIIKTQLDSINIKETVESKGAQAVHIGVNFIATSGDTSVTGAFFCLALPAARYLNTKAQLIHPASSVALRPSRSQKKGYVPQRAQGIRFRAPERKLEVTFGEPTNIWINDNDTSKTRKKIDVCLPVMSGPVHKGQHAKKSFVIKASGKVDKSPDTLSLDTSQPGRKFDGVGGNFRLQNKLLDPKVINYNLKHMRVAWARVELPWRAWQPTENGHPVDSARAGALDPKVQASMDMARRLSKEGIPLILSAWYPPAWAVKGPLHPHPVNGVWGNELDSLKMQPVYKSITRYIQYLKNKYGVHIKLFSLNESDLGINIRQTPRQHKQFIKGLGAYFQSHGLQTKLLLGDASDANAFSFIRPAMADSATHPYIGAVDFHSWRGWTDSTLARWAGAAKKLHRPLIVGEAGINAKAWHYFQVFQEPWFARREINLYVRLLDICQPETILQWQLTSDYAVLAGGGIWGNKAKSLHPTQRFWDLKQLASTPPGLHFMPIRSRSSSITSAALGNNESRVYAIHLVNNGATRRVTITGIPPDVHQLEPYVTTAKLEMKRGHPVKVRHGQVTFKLLSTSFTSLMTGSSQ